MKNPGLLLIFLGLLTSCASHKPDHVEHVNHDSSFTSETPLYFRYSGPETVSYSGLANYDDLSATGSEGVLYPGGHPAAFLASILVHAGTVEAIKESKREAIKEEADKVLTPYLDVLKDFTYKPLIENATKPLLQSNNGVYQVSTDHSASSAPKDHWIMESSPAYFMLQDSGALVLQNSIVLYVNTEEPKIVYQNVIEVISQPYQGENPEQHWLLNQGQRIAATSHKLMTDSLRIAIDDALKIQIEDASQQTFHFYQEGQKTYERGNLITALDDRLIIRTLRGWIKSVPIIRENGDYFNNLPEDQMVASVARGIGVYY